jgi:peptidoglycan-associated lipoprotein
MAQIAGRLWIAGACGGALFLTLVGCQKAIQSNRVADEVPPAAMMRVEPPKASAAQIPGESMSAPSSNGAVATPDNSSAEPAAVQERSQDPRQEPPVPFMSRVEPTNVEPEVLPETPERIEESIVVARVDPKMPDADQTRPRRPTAPELNDVFFAFDSWMITEQAKAILSNDAEWLRTYSRMVAIEGHCDERGTQAYNLVLGEKRARAVKSYLVNLGIEGAKLSVVSYGKERPFCAEREEPCYRLNRRGHFTLNIP